MSWSCKKRTIVKGAPLYWLCNPITTHCSPTFLNLIILVCFLNILSKSPGPLSLKSHLHSLLPDCSVCALHSPFITKCLKRSDDFQNCNHRESGGEGGKWASRNCLNIGKKVRRLGWTPSLHIYENKNRRYDLAVPSLKVGQTMCPINKTASWEQPQMRPGGRSDLWETLILILPLKDELRLLFKTLLYSSLGLCSSPQRRAAEIFHRQGKRTLLTERSLISFLSAFVSVSLFIWRLSLWSHNRHWASVNL